MRPVQEALLHLVYLVVDDKEECRGELTANLKAVGAKQILSAASAGEAIAILKAPPRPIDLILSDIRMPGGNGLQLLQYVRTGRIMGLRMNATFVLTTAAPEIGIIQMAGSLDANGFVVKPVNPVKFEAVLLKARRTIFPPNPGQHASVFVPAEF
jgi:two-component system response regulator YesN